ncbi:HNH endonuclease signature motif containing protein [Oceanospirillum beijerinckii]|uniref:HNH endonuclease signature motif containing protein n=1 Tax=Oceanospirillum beijerinckii TaxID=64976 RepID=UPI0004078DD8|nr:HNH endonuclease signature motif containing protein [Oceanospirillum beijerinckii]
MTNSKYIIFFIAAIIITTSTFSSNTTYAGIRSKAAAAILEKSISIYLKSKKSKVRNIALDKVSSVISKNPILKEKAKQIASNIYKKNPTLQKQYFLFLDRINAKQQLLPPVKRALNKRSTPGVAHGIDTLKAVKPGKSWLRGSHGNAARFPKQIASKMANKQFRNWDHFRTTFWKLVSKDKILRSGFSSSNISRMSQGLAPKAHTSQKNKGIDSYSLHHIKPISQGGGVYDMNNILITSPLYHNSFH